MWHISNGYMQLMLDNCSEYAMEFGKKPAYPNMDSYKKVLKEHLEKKEKEKEVYESET